MLVLGLAHNWFGIVAADALHTQGLYLISRLVVSARCSNRPAC